MKLFNKLFNKIISGWVLNYKVIITWTKLFEKLCFMKNLLESNTNNPAIPKSYLQNNSPLFVLFSGTAAFITYCGVYAFRKPFAAATFNGLTIWGTDYKIILIIAQAIGYTLSKFLGIRIVSELKPNQRIAAIIILLSIACISLLFFALIPYPYNGYFLVLNGLPLGLLWGIIFSYLEGRRSTEVLGAMMACCFIFSSGIVKAAGRMLIDQFGVTDFWMPFLTGNLFIPIIILGIYMLKRIPAPAKEDEAFRTQRQPMNQTERGKFFRSFAPGIIISIIIYAGLTIFRDLCDNFAVELWTDLGYKHTPEILALSEIPIAICVFIIIGLMMLIKKNKKAFYANQLIILSGGFLLFFTSCLSLLHLISPLFWMIIIGFSMYLLYISFHVMFYERWIALFKYKSNIGYLMYVSDAFGYFGSTCVLFLKGFWNKHISWLHFFSYSGLIIGLSITILSIISLLYFSKKVIQF